MQFCCGLPRPQLVKFSRSVSATLYVVEACCLSRRRVVSTHCMGAFVVSFSVRSTNAPAHRSRERVASQNLWPSAQPP